MKPKVKGYILMWMCFANIGVDIRGGGKADITGT